MIVIVSSPRLVGFPLLKGQGCLSYLLGIKNAVLVALRVFEQPQKVHSGSSSVPVG